MGLGHCHHLDKLSAEFVGILHSDGVLSPAGRTVNRPPSHLSLEPEEAMVGKPRG